MQKQIVGLISGLDYLEHTTEALVLHDILPFTKLMEYNVIKFMRQFESNNENEWSRRLVEGGDGYMLGNLNGLHVQRTIHSNLVKITYF